MSSPDGVTLIGRYGKGSDLTQINEINSLIIPTSSSSILYMADSQNRRILSWNLELNSATVIVGETNASESNSTLFNNPSGLAFDQQTNSLYIADMSNNRIQKYTINSRSTCTTVAGWGQLNNPSAVQLDSSDANNMFIADTLNHRILVWLNGSRQGRTIAGNGTAGNSDIQLNSPSQMRFDADYNLYVADTNNCRIQRFDLILNGC
ncbi:hypothetical protein I4U23_019426 [Adineta vaga]|nr:hypothetical protein I4U23_019426 [Adineta vaga]